MATLAILIRVAVPPTNKIDKNANGNRNVTRVRESNINRNSNNRTCKRSNRNDGCTELPKKYNNPLRNTKPDNQEVRRDKLVR